MRTLLRTRRGKCQKASHRLEAYRLSLGECSDPDPLRLLWIVSPRTRSVSLDSLQCSLRQGQQLKRLSVKGAFRLCYPSLTTSCKDRSILASHFLDRRKPTSP